MLVGLILASFFIGIPALIGLAVAGVPGAFVGGLIGLVILGAVHRD